MRSPKADDRRSVYLWTGSLAHAVQDGLTAAIYVLLPVLAQSLGLNLSEVGLYKGLKSFVQGLLEIVSGIASERFGDRALLVFGLALSGMGYLLFSQTDSGVGVLLCLIVVGVGTAFQHSPASAMISRAYAAKGRRGALGLYNSSGDAGKLAFASGFSLAVGAGLAWHTVTFAYGLAGLLAGIAILVALRASPLAWATRRRIGSVDIAGSVKGWGILDRGSFTALLVVVFLDSMVQAGALTFAAFLMLAKGEQLATATFAATAILVGGMLGKAFCGFLADRIGPRKAFSLVQVLTAVLLVAVVMAPSLLAYLLMPLLGVVLQGSTSITYGMVNDFVHPDRAARGFALVYGGSGFSTVVGPLTVGVVGDAHGVAAGILVLAVASLLAIAPCWWLRVVPKAEQAAP
jgi:FSR family fosmidomycin resistance protein-like MFS transporter